MDEITEDSVPSSITVVEAVENPAAPTASTAKIEENIKEYCIRIEDFLQTLEQSPKADAEVSAFFRVPAHMRDRERGELLYDPKHINFSRIRSMLLTPRPDDKEKKLLSHYYRHLQSILKVNGKRLTDCMEMMNKLNREEILKNCYPVQDNWQKIAFSIDYHYLLGLLFSGCFIIDLIRRWSMDRSFPEFDKECGGIWASELWVDLLLVENQIPFFILQRIQETMPMILRFRCEHSDESRALEELVFTFYNDFLPLKEPKKVNRPTEQFHHLLHFVHQCLLPEVKEERHRCCTFWGTLAALLFILFISPLACIFMICAYIWKCFGYLWIEKSIISRFVLWIVW